MFFAEKLGPLVTDTMVNDLFGLVKAESAGRASISAEDLRALVSRYAARRGLAITPDAALNALARAGRIAFVAEQERFDLAA